MEHSDSSSSLCSSVYNIYIYIRAPGAKRLFMYALCVFINNKNSLIENSLIDAKVVGYKHKLRKEQKTVRHLKTELSSLTRSGLNE